MTTTNKAGKHTPYTIGREILSGYEVCDDGRVFSLSSNWRGYGKRLMRTDLNSHGYERVRLTVNGRRKVYFIHKLVAEAYLEPRPSRTHEIRHLDGNKMNNSHNNLCWGTSKDNACDRSLHGRTSHGLTHSNAIKRGQSSWLLKIRAK
jgi:hypothetical protein